MSGDPMDIKVTYNSLDDTAGDIERGAAAVRKQIDDILAAVKKVTAGWEGEAHEMMLAAEKQFNVRANHIETTLKEVATKVRRGKMDYHSTDKKNANLFKDISF
ncbi:WXG100 family type VII secretion target [Streptomyces sp. NEAU-Y11]|uniref:WXG100 family type VII secretion target n=1 Tax=Streptomyces cucumeris TaxID=2962890 RepID=UPI0020C92F1C|nr:WXG100 family type VII secretion target [Streptomyces sp. NEAU-Y11]MCP9209370.1 WXG100 family type VII secretion target [Streptomyces sp. NEAU-Y11]